MMNKRSLPNPTDAEVAILRVLWSRGPSTVGEVQKAHPRQSGYTTVLKLMQIMTDKGWLLRDERKRTHVYRPARSEKETQRRLVRDLTDRAFGGSAANLILSALSSKPASTQELAEIRQLLDEMEKKGKPDEP